MKFFLFVILFAICGSMFAQTPGNALNFDGSNDMVVSSTVPPLFSNLTVNSFTYEAWVYPSGSAFQRVIFAQPSTTNFSTFGTSTGNVIYFYVIANSTTYSSATTTSIPQNQWTHVACRWDASTLTEEIFFNGVLQPTIAGGTSTTGTSGLLTLGTRPGGTQYFSGSLDEVRIWSEARSQCEIQNNMNSEFTGPVTNLEVYYNFNQGVAGGTNTGVTNLPDINGTYNGTVTNFTLTGATSNWIASGAVINDIGPNVGLQGSITATICANDTFMFGGIPRVASGSYDDTLIASTGCDSIVTLGLTVLSPITSNLNATACDQYVFNSTTLYATGTYYDTVPAFGGCDSMITLNLTINHAQPASLSVSSCDQYVFNSVILNTSGVYHDTLFTVNGCDSIITLDLTINNSQTSSFSTTSCDQYDFNGTILFSSGSYTDTLVTMNGCDSVVTLNLIINSADVTVNQVGFTLTSPTSGAIYQWLDCNNSFAVIPSANTNVYTASANGSYALEITENGCTDTSGCFTINTFDVNNESENILVIYPNPTDGWLQVQLNIDQTKVQKLELMNLNGQILRTVYVDSPIVNMDITEYAPGVYLLRAVGNVNGKVYRIIRN